MASAQHAPKRRQMTQAQLHARRGELLTARGHRGLTDVERVELDNLDHRFAMRVWHQQLREASRQLESARA